MRSCFTRYRQTVFCKLYKHVGCVYSTTFRFEIRPMTGNIFGHEDTEITLFKIRFFQYGFQSMIGINFLAYSDRGFNPLLFGMLSRTIFMAKTGFSFLAPNSNFDRNFTKLRQYFRTLVEFRNEWWSSTRTRHFSTTSKKPFADIW